MSRVLGIFVQTHLHHFVVDAIESVRAIRHEFMQIARPSRGYTENENVPFPIRYRNDVVPFIFPKKLYLSVKVSVQVTDNGPVFFIIFVEHTSWKQLNAPSDRCLVIAISFQHVNYNLPA